MIDALYGALAVVAVELVLIATIAAIAYSQRERLVREAVKRAMTPAKPATTRRTTDAAR